MSQPVPADKPAPVSVQVGIVGCLSLPNNMQPWVAKDAASAQALTRMLGGANLIITLDNIRQMWEQATGQKHIIVPAMRAKPPWES